MKMGFIHGRFQILHNDHMKYLLAGKKQCDHLVVGITNPDPTLTKDDAADSHRSSQDANPLTYYERYVMVRGALRETGLGLDEFAVVPFPVNFPELYQYYIPKNSVFFLTIYDDWGERKLSMFESLGLTTEILWRRPLEEKGLTSSKIRYKVAHGEKYDDLVPPSVAKWIREMGLAERLQKLRL